MAIGASVTSFAVTGDDNSQAEKIDSAGLRKLAVDANGKTLNVDISDPALTDVNGHKLKDDWDKNGVSGKWHTVLVYLFKHS